MSSVHSKEMKRTLQKRLINGDSFHNARKRRFTFSSAAIFAYLYGRDEPKVIKKGKQGQTEIIQDPTKTSSMDSWCFCQNAQAADCCALHGVGREQCNGTAFHPSRALRTLPTDVYLCLSGVPGAQYGICTRKPIPVGTWIGPFEGRQVRPDELKAGMDTSCMWEIYDDNKISHFIDGSDADSSSWMKFIQCARSKDEQNLHAFQRQENIFYRSFRNIALGEELLVWYDDRYPQLLGIPTGLQYISFTVSAQDVGSSSLAPKPPVLHCTFTNHQPSPVSDSNGDVTPEDSLVPITKDSTESEFTSWRCQQCHKTFTQLVALQMHVCPRQPEKPLQCGQCGQAFNNATLLRLHVVSHSREKPFKCGFCSRAFAGTTTLNNHMRTHTGQKPFACEACGKAFLQAGQLARHVRDPRECPLPISTTRGFNKSSALLA